MQAIHNALQQEEKCTTYAISKETAKEAVRIMRVLVHEKKELLNEADAEEVRLLVRAMFCKQWPRHLLILIL